MCNINNALRRKTDLALLNEDSQARKKVLRSFDSIKVYIVIFSQYINLQISAILCDCSSTIGHLTAASSCNLLRKKTSKSNK